MESPHQHVTAPRLHRSPTPSIVRLRPVSRAATHDERWPAVAAALAGLRERKRCSVRIVDADCGAGCLLLHALRHARALGFTAIEGRGIDGAPALIGRARAAASRLVDPAIGVVFENGDTAAALGEEEDFPADIVLWRGATGAARPAIFDALRRAGQLLIGTGDASPAKMAA